MAYIAKLEFKSQHEVNVLSLRLERTYCGVQCCDNSRLSIEAIQESIYERQKNSSLTPEHVHCITPNIKEKKGEYYLPFLYCSVELICDKTVNMAKEEVNNTEYLMSSSATVYWFLDIFESQECLLLKPLYSFAKKNSWLDIGTDVIQDDLL